MIDTKPSVLDEAFRESMGPGAFEVSEGRGPFMEISDTATGLVWMTTSAVTRADYNELSINPPLQKTGLGYAAMDRAAFASSPGNDEGAILRREIGGWEWINVARPLQVVPPDERGGPFRISVNKAHVIGFRAHRNVSVLRLPHGDYVEVVGEGTDDDQLVLPERGILEKLDLKRPWVLQLPAPTDAYFWPGKSMRSFQGPISLP
ncbi:hypothetical protein MK280_06035 [Myxococcota bacterium]|nr:hypothetical protein [Myxococcota bacterium]